LPLTLKAPAVRVTATWSTKEALLSETKKLNSLVSPRSMVCGLSEPSAPGVWVRVALAVNEGVALVLGEAVAVGDALGVALAVGLTVALGLCVGEGLKLGVWLGVAVMTWTT
jgi:hypothetical protein